jgi:hypothetical protein
MTSTARAGQARAPHATGPVQDCAPQRARQGKCSPARPRHVRAEVQRHKRWLEATAAKVQVPFDPAGPLDRDAPIFMDAGRRAQLGFSQLIIQGTPY